jgi:hypothetical protein
MESRGAGDVKKPEIDEQNEKTEQPESTQPKPPDDDMDISTPCWFYVDVSGVKQGPFCFREMFTWWKSRYFNPDLQVKTVWDEEYRELGTLPEFLYASPKLIERIEKEQDEIQRKGLVEVPLPTYYDEPPPPPKQFEEYVVTGTFNPLTGRFQKDDTNSYFAARGIASDKDLRMMGNYFDVDRYQTEMLQGSGDAPKQVKGSKKFWKERKEKKKRAKLVAEYLKD